MNQIDYNSPEYKRSRTAYIAQSTFEYFISLLVADAFLAKLLTSIGLSDAVVGIVSSFISVAFVIQLASIPLVRTKISTKKLVITFDTLSQLLYMLCSPFADWCNRKENSCCCVDTSGIYVQVSDIINMLQVGKYLCCPHEESNIFCN